MIPTIKVIIVQRHFVYHLAFGEHRLMKNFDKDV